MTDSQMEHTTEVDTTGSVAVGDKEETPPKKKRGRRSTKSTKRTTRKSTKKNKKLPEYNVDVHPETGVMQLQELYFLRLINAEQRIKIGERDLHIARAGVKDFQTQANVQLQSLQNKVKETKESLQSQKTLYISEVKAVEEATGLVLKDWTVDDDRILRPIEKEKQSE